MGRPKKTETQQQSDLKASHWLTIPPIAMDQNGNNQIGNTNTFPSPSEMVGSSEYQSPGNNFINKQRNDGSPLPSCMFQNEAYGAVGKRANLGGMCQTEAYGSSGKRSSLGGEPNHNELSGALGIRQIKRPMLEDPRDSPQITWKRPTPLPPITPRDTPSEQQENFDPLPAFTNDEMETFLESLQKNSDAKATESSTNQENTVNILPCIMI